MEGAAAYSLRESSGPGGGIRDLATDHAFKVTRIVSANHVELIGGFGVDITTAVLSALLLPFVREHLGPASHGHAGPLSDARYDAQCKVLRLLHNDVPRVGLQPPSAQGFRGCISQGIAMPVDKLLIAFRRRRRAAAMGLDFPEQRCGAMVANNFVYDSP